MKFNEKENNCSIIQKFHYPVTFVSLLDLKGNISDTVDSTTTNILVRGNP